MRKRLKKKIKKIDDFFYKKIEKEIEEEQRQIKAVMEMLSEPISKNEKLFPLSLLFVATKSKFFI